VIKNGGQGGNAGNAGRLGQPGKNVVYKMKDLLPFTKASGI